VAGAEGGHELIVIVIGFDGVTWFLQAGVVDVIAQVTTCPLVKAFVV
jgi:hypothetical protein